MSSTIHDVAHKARVSVKTVSRVLNSEPGVREATRHRVTHAIEDLGYQPHSGARSLRGHAPNCVGVALGAPAETVPLSHELLAWLFMQLYETFGAQGNYVCFDLNPHNGGHGDYARGLWERLYRGLIVTGPLAVDDTILRRVHESGKPYLALGRLASMPEGSSATVDFAQGVYLATKYLLDKGHRRIALLSSLKGYEPGRERIDGYRRALEEAGMAYDETVVEIASFTTTGVINGIHRLLADSTVTALIDSTGAEDGAAIREGVRRAGRVAGENVEVVGWTYACDAVILKEASAHVWVPVRESLLAGVRQFAEWFNGLREEPVKVLYPPILQPTGDGEEAPRPRLVFGTRE